jgi:HEAT repeat protein
VLVTALGDSNDSVRAKAAEALVRNGKDTLPLLIEALKGGKKQVQIEAARALGFLGRDARAVVPTLVEQLRGSRDSDVRWDVSRALGSIGPDAREAAPALAEMLEDRSRPEWYPAVEALEKMGAGAREAVPALSKLLEDTRKVPAPQPPSATYPVPPFAERQGGFVVPAQEAANALGAMGPEARAAVPALRRALRKAKSEELRTLFEWALEQIEPREREKG